MARPTPTLQDPALLAAALEGLELQRKRIDDQIAAVRAMLGGKKIAAPSAAPAASEGPARRKRVLSEEARQRIAAAQKKRWASFRKGKKSE
ncbi:MAG: hypothetical protein K7J46_07995 [Bryobacter sp.]|jgi:hypothetical protein|nr:hypothetical protein [Bryobacter sp. CoA8 C33]